MPRKHQSLSSRYYGYRVSDRDDTIKYLVLKVEQELIDDCEVRRVTPWELYHRDGSDNSFEGMKFYTIYLSDGSHFKAALTESAYDDLRN